MPAGRTPAKPALDAPSSLGGGFGGMLSKIEETMKAYQGLPSEQKIPKVDVAPIVPVDPDAIKVQPVVKARDEVEEGLMKARALTDQERQDALLYWRHNASEVKNTAKNPVGWLISMSKAGKLVMVAKSCETAEKRRLWAKSHEYHVGGGYMEYCETYVVVGSSAGERKIKYTEDDRFWTQKGL